MSYVAERGNHNFFYASGVTQRILSVAFDIDELKSYVIAGAGLAAINLFTLGTAMCQRKHCEIWDKNLKRDS